MMLIRSLVDGHGEWNFQLANAVNPAPRTSIGLSQLAIMPVISGFAKAIDDNGGIKNEAA
jgi:hypothetical protein